MSNSGKVKCTCGWSWNKSDSSKKDMYICHECGRDNSNNMQNGGWLDSYEDGGTMQEHQENYNNSEVSLPEGFVGMGNNTKGRNYSPAWGGQFEDGGELIPMAQNGRATAADSLDVYNRSLKIDAYYNNLRKKGWYKKPKITDVSWLTSKDLKEELKRINKETVDTYNDQSKQDSDDSYLTKMYPNKNIKETNLKALAEHKKLTRGTRYAMKDLYPNAIDPVAPTTVVDTRIIPKEVIDYDMRGDSNDISVTPPGGSITGLYRYDPLSVKPWNMLTDAEKKLRVKKYGTDGVPKSYINASKDKLNKDPKPDKKPNPNKKLNIDPKPKQEVVQPDLPRVEAINLPPMQQLGSMSAPTTSDVVREPKSYNVSRKTYNMKGLNDYYTTDEEGVDYERAMLQKSAADAYNRDILKRYGPQNEYRTPKSAKDAAERLKQLRSEFEMTPNYQMGGSVYPVNYVPQAQNGKLTFLQPTSEKLPEGYRIPYADPSSELAMSIGGENGEPAYLIPSFKYGKPLYNPIEEFKKTGEHLGGPFKTWQEADKWEQEVRHPAVEKKENIMFPQEQFAMGGSIPGAVGFSYARTQSPAPSNGKYAKKTMASAQNGQEMKYYQEGLDFKPKTISKDGAWLNKYDVAQDGKKAYPEFKKIVAKSEEEKLRESLKERPRAVVKESIQAPKLPSRKNIKESTLTKKGAVTRDSKGVVVLPNEQGVYEPYSPEVGEVSKYTPQSTASKTWEVLTNPLTAVGYGVRNQRLPDNFSLGDRSNLDMATDVINPAAWVNYGATGLSDLSNVPGQLIEGDFQGAGESTLFGTMNLLGALPLGQELKPFIPSALKTLPKVKNIREALGTFKGIPAERSLPRLSPEELKIYRQAQGVGRLRAEGKPISQQYKYALEENIPEEHLQKIFGKTKAEIENSVSSITEQEARLAQGSEDMFNSMPESLRSRVQAIDLRRNVQIPTSLDDTFAQLDAGTHVSQTNPFIRNSMSNQLPSPPEELIINTRRSRIDPEAMNAVMNYSDDADDLIINYGDDFDTSGPSRSSMNTITQNPKLQRATNALQEFRAATNTISENQITKANKKLAEFVSGYPYYKGPVMQNVPSLSLSSLGSLKNVSNKVTNQSTSGINSGDIFTGSLDTSHSSYLPQLKKVFKYNEGAPQFFGYKPMNTMGFLNKFGYSSDDIAKYLNTEIDDQIRKGMVPNNVLRPIVKKESVILPHYGIKQFKEGGVIKDDMGQWNHPGEITEIGSPYITMQGVPYPVLGISDTGDIQMMYPEEDYEFDGEKVTEYPMAKNGIRQEQKSLQNLDNLTNFTNYNKPQPGGWLNKYN